METIIVSIIENNTALRDSVMRYIAMQPEFEAASIQGSVEAWLNKPLKKYLQPEVLLLDIGLSQMSGIEGIPHILARQPELSIIMFSVHDEEDLILRALCSGACSYISKSASLDDISEAIRIVAAGGAYMSPSIARKIVNHFVRGRVSKASILSQRQKEILELLVEGKSYQVIAAHLCISIETVRSHIKKMYKVLQVNNKTEAIAKYMRGQIR